MPAVAARPLTLTSRVAFFPGLPSLSICTQRVYGYDVATFPKRSMTATFTAGVMGRFGVVLLGSTMNFGSIQAPGLTPNDPLVTDAMPSADASSRYPLPAFLMVKPENVATPATALASCWPPNAPPPGFA